jgi:hypothetical protein
MIAADLKAKHSQTSALNLSADTQDEPIVSFSTLLKDVKLSKDSKDTKDSKLDGAIVLDFKDEKNLKLLDIKEEKNTKENKLNLLLSLVKNDLKSDELEPVLSKDIPIEINPQAIKNLSTKDIKLLINDAKLYLKNKILNSDGYKKAQIKDMPKTLKGLVHLAKKFDIDVSKITVEIVQAKMTKVDATPLELSKFTKKDDINLLKPKEVKNKPQDIKSLLSQIETKTTPKTISKNDKKEDIDLAKPKDVKDLPNKEVPKEVKTAPQEISKNDKKEDIDLAKTKEVKDLSNKEAPKEVKDLPNKEAPKEVKATSQEISKNGKKDDIDLAKDIKDLSNKEVPKEVKTAPQEVKEVPKKEAPKEIKTASQEISKNDKMTEADLTEPKELKDTSQEVKDISNKELPKEVKTTPQTIPQNTKKEEIKDSSQEVKDISNKELPKEVKKTPQAIPQNTNKEEVKDSSQEVKVQPQKDNSLFKTHTQSTKQTSTKQTSTEQIVQAKLVSQIPLEVKTPKQKADETLKLLLRGEKPSKEGSLTADFSVATAKVIAPQAMTNSQQALESLLRSDTNDKSDSSQVLKQDNTNAIQTDSLDVKLKEAKHMIKYLSSDVKDAIDDYKSPFTKLKVQLNPKNLGEIDLTIVQRGKNLRVNITSNNVAISTLSMNINELKMQLSNNGINNATFNFSGNAQGDDQQAQQQNNHRNEQKANEEYKHFENEEENEEILSSLEIIVPQYG